MSIRQAARRVAIVVASVSAASAFSIAMLAGPAGAATPTEGSIVPNSAVPIGSFTAGTPFSSGQGIDVVVPANSVFTQPQPECQHRPMRRTEWRAADHPVPL